MLWGLVAQVQVLKAGVPDAGLRPFAPQEKLRGEPVTRSVAAATLGMGVTATLRLRSLLATSTGAFAWAQCVGVAQLVLGFLFLRQLFRV